MIAFNSIFCALFVLNFINILYSQDACKTVDEQSGECVLLNKCSIYYDVIKFSFFTPSELESIMQNRCGTFRGQEKVCCPKLEKAKPIPRPIFEPTVETTTGKFFVARRKFNESTLNRIAIIDEYDFSDHSNIKLLDQQICGNIFDDRIAKGNLTEIFEFPWVSIIQYRTDDGIEQLCSGTVINQKYVLTAAHCIKSLREGFSVHSVIFGEHNTRKLIDCMTNDPQICADPPQIIPIDKLIVHPEYNRRKFLNDIGLIRMKWNIDFSTESVRPICLPLAPRTQISLPSVKITGWGRTEYGESSSVLLQANLEVVNNTYCDNLYKNRTRIRIVNSQLCAGISDSDSCKGDSGGPAIYPANTDFGPRYVQYGIVSGGVNTCGINYGLPGIYTRVAFYIKWILDNMDD